MANNKATIANKKFKIKTGDEVIVIRGASKGQKGEVKEIMRAKDRVVVSGVNIVKKHVKPTNNDPGGIKDMEAPVHISNVMLVDPKSGEPTRVGRRVEDDKIVRYSTKSGQPIS